MNIKINIVLFVFAGFCYGMRSDIENYQHASLLAQRGFENRLFSFVEQHKLDVNKHFDEEKNTLMHKIASCEDTVAFDEMIAKAVNVYKGNLFVPNQRGETPFMTPLLYGNKYNSFKILGFIDPEILNRHIALNYPSYINDCNQAMWYKQNQEHARIHIANLLVIQTNNNHNLSIRFSNEKDLVISAGKKYLLVNLKRFQMLPTLDAQCAALAHELDHHYKHANTVRILSSIKDPFELKKFNWYCELDADYAATKKYPKGTIELLEYLQKTVPNNISTETHPPYALRLSIVKSLIDHYKIKM